MIDDAAQTDDECRTTKSQQSLSSITWSVNDAAMNPLLREISTFVKMLLGLPYWTLLNSFMLAQHHWVPDPCPSYAPLRVFLASDRVPSV